VASSSGRSRSSRRVSPPGVAELLRPDSPTQLRANLSPRPGRRCRVGGRGVIIRCAGCDRRPDYESVPRRHVLRTGTRDPGADQVEYGLSLQFGLRFAGVRPKCPSDQPGRFAGERVGGVGVDAGCGDLGMPEDALNDVHVHVLLPQQGPGGAGRRATARPWRCPPRPDRKARLLVADYQDSKQA
jgi:hypothetical protein